MQRRAGRWVVVVGGLLALVSGPMAAQPAQISWQDLPRRVAKQLIPIEKLGLRDCPQDLALRTPSRRALQVIENTFYSWEEYDLEKVKGGPFCVVMREPLEQALTAREAQVLMSASNLWQGRTPEGSAKRGASQGTPFAEGPAPSQRPAPPRALLPPQEAGGNLDRGITGWAPPPGKAARQAEPEGPPRSGPKNLGPISEGSVIGQDDRQRVSNTTVFPFNVISSLRLNSNLSSPYGTGTLVSPYMVLTNGHVVWDDNAGSFVGGLTISPGQANFAGRQAAVRLATNVGWVTTRRLEYDYSAAFVNQPFPGISTFMPLVFDVAPGAGGIVNIAGFPAEAQGAATDAMWLHTDKVTGVQGRMLRYSVDTSGGNSGSPVWELFSATGLRRAIAVHAQGDPVLRKSNGGSRLVFQNFDLISEWMKWTPQTRNGLNLTINQIDADECPVVRLAVSVTDNAGKPVADLTRNNFTVLENGVRQTISLSQGNLGNAPLAVTLVLDASGSLSDSDVANIQAAGRAFINLLGARDRTAVYHFANGVARAQDFTTDKAVAIAAVNALNNDGGAVGDGSRTALFDAIVEAAGHSPATGRRALVVMTDGLNNTGFGTLSSAVQAARAAGVPVFTIGFGSADQFVLDQIAVQTGGRFFLGASSADLQAILQAIGRTLDNQYLLSWTTKFISGGTEQIEVRVEDSGQSDQQATSYSQANKTGCPPPNVGCTVRIDAPKQGDVWMKGTPKAIRWSTDGVSCGSTVSIGVTNDSDVWFLGDTPDDGVQNYNIDFLPTGSNYSAVVADHSTQAGGTSVSGTFSIQVAKAGLSCTAGPETLCLGKKKRFLVRLLWRSPEGAGGFGKTIPLTENSGAFFFRDSTSPELVVKVFDGQAVNAHHWVFTGALTDVKYSAFVTDTTTGQTRVYSNQPGELLSFGDVTAFGPPPESSPESDPPPVKAVPEEGQEEDDGQKASTNPLWSQLDRVGGLIISSEKRLEPGGASRDTEGADDFVVPANTTWNIDGVDVIGQYFGPGPHGPADSVNVRIYADKNGAPGPLQCNYNRLQPRAGRTSGTFEVDLPNVCQAQGGRFWLAVQANQDFNTAGQWGWAERAVQREKPSVWRNPGGGYGTACNNFGARAAVCRVGDDPDFLFRLRGQINSGGGGSCKVSSTNLCLRDKKYKLEVSFKNAAGKPVAATAVGIGTAAGYFWFSNKANPEVAVKIVDGRPLNGKFWLFYGGLTEVEFTLKVTDTVTGASKSYLKRAGRLVSAADLGGVPGS